MKTILPTSYSSNDKVLFNSDLIRIVSRQSGENFSVLFMIDDDKGWKIKETPEQIMTMINSR